MNFHAVFNAAGKDVDVILQEVRIRCAPRNRGISGLVFVSDRLPDFDQFAYTDSWTESNYQQFADRKRLQRSPFLSHEPVAFFNSQNNAARVKLDTPRRGRFITIKVSCYPPPLCSPPFVAVLLCAHISHLVLAVVIDPTRSAEH